MDYYRDAQAIKGVFPEYSLEEIIAILEEVGNKEDRIRIAIKTLLRKSNNLSLKRTLVDEVGEDSNKKRKIAESSSTVGKANSTIVRPTSPEENEPPRFFTPPCEQPLNVTSRTQKILPEATATGAEPVTPVEAENANLIHPLLEIFPEACPEFIRRICRGTTNAPGVIDDLIAEILQSNYPKRNQATSPVQTMDAEAQLEMLQRILPNAESEEQEILSKGTPVEAENANLIYHLLEIFPEACPEFIRWICRGKTNAPGVIDDLIAEILQSNYPKRNKATSPVQTMNAEAQLEMLKRILPNADREEEEILSKGTEKRAEPVNPVEAENANLIYHLLEIFPEACPEFIRRICRGKTNAPGVIDDLIAEILQSDYPKRNKATSLVQTMYAEAQLEMLKKILPDADPSYLEIHCDRLIAQPEDMKMFIANAIENPSYPKLKDYLRKQQISAQQQQQKQYTTEFNVENFLKVIPDPRTYFEDSKRKQSVYDNESEHYAINFLRNHFCNITLRTIEDSFKSQKQNLLNTFKLLENFDQRMRIPEVIQNIPLLPEISYIQHRSEIEEYIRLQKAREEEERAAAAAAAGLMQSCSCCFDNEVLQKHIYTCENGCTFCKECVQRVAEASFVEGKLDFDCLNNCPSHFSLQTLRAALDPTLFSKIAIKKQAEEVKAAGIEDLEMCPFCDFATIPAKEDKIFHCRNPKCMKESNRLCKEPSHVPLRCEEVEKEDNVKRRTYIENKMTEALLRTCYKCNKKFIKAEGGCNKVICSCGALMCYVCGKPIEDITHFNGRGETRFDLCPLFSDTNKMHQGNVLMGAAQAKKEVGVDDNSVKLEIDPTSDVEQHYKDITKEPPLERQRNFQNQYAPSHHH